MADHMVKMSEVPKGQRFRQFMDYYKYRVIASILVIAALVPLVYQNVFAPQPDATFLAATKQAVSAEVWDQVTESLSAMVPDENGDGESLAFVETVFADSSYQNKNGEYHMAYQTKLMALLQDATHALQIIDADMIEHFSVQACLATYEELPELPGHDSDEPILIPLRDLKPFREIQALPDNLFMSLRPREAVNRGRHKDEADYYDKQLELLRAMMA